MRINRYYACKLHIGTVILGKSQKYAKFAKNIRIECEVCMPGMRECRDMEKKNRIESIFVQVVQGSDFRVEPRD